MKNARLPITEEPSALDSAESKPNRGMPPRPQRLIAALLPRSGMLLEVVSRIAGASSGPLVIAELRHRWLVDIGMQRIDSTVRDGKPCLPGFYRLKSKGTQRALELTSGRDG